MAGKKGSWMPIPLGAGKEMEKEIGKRLQTHGNRISYNLDATNCY